MSEDEQRANPGLGEGVADTEPPPELADPLAWARALLWEQARCLHLPSRTVGKVRAVHGPGEYLSTMDRKPVKKAVVEMEGGNAFTAVEEAFVPLTEGEATFYLEAQKVIGTSAKTCAVEGSARGLSRQMALLLIGVALRQTAQTVEMVQRATPKVGPPGATEPAPPPVKE